MTRPRSSLISLETTPYYHCSSRCVRRAFLCGQDVDGRSYDHRKQWIVDRLRHLANLFAIDIAAYAVMSNHYHLVLHVDLARASAWEETEVLQRWAKLYRGPELLQRYQRGESLEPAELKLLKDLAHHWRLELCSISRFMACMNYVIALRANREDHCTGRFWEGRFTSQALVDDTALLACMAYVDLNPVRAGIANDLESSAFTSIRDRILRARGRGKAVRRGPRLMPFSEDAKEQGKKAAIPFRYRDYLELVDWQGRHHHPLKRGHISRHKPRLLAAVGLNDGQWRQLTAEIGKEASTLLHGREKLEQIENRALNRQAA